MDTELPELRAVPFALKVCRCVAGEEYRNEPANTPAFRHTFLLMINMRLPRDSHSQLSPEEQATMNEKTPFVSLRAQRSNLKRGSQAVERRSPRRFAPRDDKKGSHFHSNYHL